MDLVSVVIPVYNAVSYLRHCVDSVIRQSYRPLEIILVDDGSTDGCQVICDTYAAEYPFVKVCHLSNGGASYARKKGVDLCSGEYITFVDSDDVIEPDYLEILWDTLQEQGTQVAACKVAKHQENKNLVVVRKHGSHLLTEEELLFRFFRYEFWGFYGKIYRKKLFDDVYFPKATINEDYVVMAQLFHKCKQMAYVDIPLYHYLIHENSLSHQRLSLRMMDEWTNKLWCYNFYVRNNPNWAKYAEAQTGETCCKLLAAIDDAEAFSIYKREMNLFLRKHFFSLLYSRVLVTGLKLMIIKRFFYR